MTALSITVLWNRDQSKLKARWPLIRMICIRAQLPSIRQICVGVAMLSWGSHLEKNDRAQPLRFIKVICFSEAHFSPAERMFTWSTPIRYIGQIERQAALSYFTPQWFSMMVDWRREMHCGFRATIHLQSFFSSFSSPIQYFI